MATDRVIQCCKKGIGPSPFGLLDQNIINLFFTFLGVEKSKVKALADFLSGKGLLPGS